MQGPFYPSNKHDPETRTVVVLGLRAGKLDRDSEMHFCVRKWNRTRMLMWVHSTEIRQARRMYSVA